MKLKKIVAWAIVITVGVSITAMLIFAGIEIVRRFHYIPFKVWFTALSVFVLATAILVAFQWSLDNLSGSKE